MVAAKKPLLEKVGEDNLDHLRLFCADKHGPTCRKTQLRRSDAPISANSDEIQTKRPEIRVFRPITRVSARSRRPLDVLTNPCGPQTDFLDKTSRFRPAAYRFNRKWVLFVWIQTKFRLNFVWIFVWMCHHSTWHCTRRIRHLSSTKYDYLGMDFVC